MLSIRTPRFLLGKTDIARSNCAAVGAEPRQVLIADIERHDYVRCSFRFTSS